MVGWSAWLLLTLLSTTVLSASPGQTDADTHHTLDILSLPCKASVGVFHFDPSQTLHRTGLSQCSEYSSATCCNATHSSQVRTWLVGVLPDTSVSCRRLSTTVQCMGCSPEVGVGLQKTVCASMCDQWFSHCKDDWWTREGRHGLLQLCRSSSTVCSRLSEIVDSGFELCRAAGYKVGRAECFDGRPSKGIQAPWTSGDDPAGGGGWPDRHFMLLVLCAVGAGILWYLKRQERAAQGGLHVGLGKDQGAERRDGGAAPPPDILRAAELRRRQVEAELRKRQ